MDNAGSCDEEAAFRSQCGSKVRAWDDMRKQSRLKRGLVVRWTTKPWGLKFGAGHLLELLFHIHTLCASVERYCYVTLFDTDYEEYFGYANGLSWSPRPRELLQYSDRASVEFAARSHDDAYRILYNLSTVVNLPSLAAASLIEVSIDGLAPLFHRERTKVQNTLSAAGAMDAGNGPMDAALHRLVGLDPCLCRDVTQPRFPNRPIGATPFPRHAVHLRSGLADVGPMNPITWPSQLLKTVVPSPPRETALRWAAAACDAVNMSDALGPSGAVATFGSRADKSQLWREPVFVFSDSAGLLRALREQSPLVQTLEAGYAQPVGQSRSWDVDREVKFRALDTIVAAGRSRVLYVAPQRLNCFCLPKPFGRHGMRVRGVADCPRYSLGRTNQTNITGSKKRPRPRRCDQRHWSSFYLPLITRSHCIESVSLNVPGCSGFDRTFLRDLPIQLAKIANGGWKRHAESAALAIDGLRWSLGPLHPCANLTASSCYSALLATGSGGGWRHAVRSVSGGRAKRSSGGRVYRKL